MTLPDMRKPDLEAHSAAYRAGTLKQPQSGGGSYLQAGAGSGREVGGAPGLLSDWGCSIS